MLFENKIIYSCILYGFMKKIIAVICLLCYTASVFGLSFSLRFCNDELKGISFSNPTKKVQCCCSGDEDSNCCNHTTVKAKKANEHYRLVTKNIITKIIDILPVFAACYTNAPFLFVAYTIVSRPLLKPPPLIVAHSPLYIIHSVFRI